MRTKKIYEPKRWKSAYKGVYIRTNSYRAYDGKPDECYYIVYYDENRKFTYETVGWKSEGYSVEAAVQVREERIRKNKELRRLKKKNAKTRSGKRVKSRYTGVYVRTSPCKVCADGRPDKCYDIMYYDENGKVKYEKVGRESEGYSIQDAVSLRAKKTRKNQKPENMLDPLFQDVWELYLQNWIPNLKAGAEVVHRIVRHVLPEFKNCRLSSITGLEVEKLKRKLLLCKKQNGEYRLKTGSARAILSDLRRILRKAKEWGLYSGEVPVFHLPPADDKRERFLSPTEDENLLEVLKLISCDLYYISKISLYTGMRLSEVLNLTVSNINFESKIIYINNGKTGNRVSYISDTILHDLKKIVQNKENYLFVGKNNQKLNRNRISIQFSYVVNSMGFNDSVTDSKNKIVFHSLRHTFCSWLAIKGVPLLTIGELAGHTTLEMTHRYAKLSPNTKRSAIELIDEVITGGKEI